jgi:ribonucleotide monophosphatase NagD (HAD superfamily)
MITLFLFLVFSWAHADCSSLSEIEGYLIDLDGTIYNPLGLITGAKTFVEWLIDNQKPFVFVSNSGAKGPMGVQAKLKTPPFDIFSYPLPTEHFYTAAVSIAKYLETNAAPHSRIYFLQSTAQYGFTRDSCIKTVNATIPKLFSTYEWRTDLSLAEIKSWSTYAQAVPGSTFVVSCADGQISDDYDPKTGQPGYTGWDFDILSKATILIQNGATYVNHAPDTHNVVKDPYYPNLNLNTPGPGTFFDLLTSSTFPDSVNRVNTVGKGGSLGTEFTMEPSLDLLRAQGWSGDPSRVAIIGDTLNTDIAAGNKADMISIFVLSGVHTEADLKFYSYTPTCILDNVGDIPPLSKSK